MAITSDFEKRPYKTLMIRFSWQFLLFIVGLLVSAGVMYGIEYKYSFDDQWSHYDESSYKADVMHEIEHFVNDAGFSAIKEFSKTHNVHSANVKEFVRKIAKIRYLGYQNHTEYDEYEFENLYGHGMSFLQAVSLVFSTVTSVGWGHVTPAKIGGQAFTCIIAIIGIPLTFIMIISGSQIIIRLSKDVIRKIFGINRVDILYKPFIAFFIFVYVTAAAAIIAKIEGFDYRTAVWYSIMSLTTVGFGDVVQESTIYHGRESRKAGVLVFQILWLIFGFILIGALILSVVYEHWGDGRNTQFHQILKTRNNDEELVENEDE